MRLPPLTCISQIGMGMTCKVLSQSVGPSADLCRIVRVLAMKIGTASLACTNARVFPRNYLLTGHQPTFRCISLRGSSPSVLMSDGLGRCYLLLVQVVDVVQGLDEKQQQDGKS